MSGIVRNIHLHGISDYSSAQRIGFAGILIGFILCGAGCFAPYWKSGKVSISGSLFPDMPFDLGGIKLMEINEGLWTFCVDLAGVDSRCSSSFDVADTISKIHKFLNPKDQAKNWLVIACGASFVCLVLAIICGCAACCRSCCCSGGKTVCHGVMTFLAGGLGIFAVAIFASKSEDIYGIPLIDFAYGWSFYIFAAGSAVLVICSFLLCFASPRTYPYQVMTEPAVNMPSVVVASSTSNHMTAMSPYPANGGQNNVNQMSPY